MAPIYSMYRSPIVHIYDPNYKGFTWKTSGTLQQIGKSYVRGPCTSVAQQCECNVQHLHVRYVLKDKSECWHTTISIFVSGGGPNKKLALFQTLLKKLWIH